jgi:hypothetical protein
MMRPLAPAIVAVALALQTSAQAAPSKTCTPPAWLRHENFVSSAADAITLATIYLRSLFGQKDVLDAEPFTASRAGHTWTVKGYVPPDVIGGSYVVKLDARSGCLVSAIEEQ